MSKNAVVTVAKHQLQGSGPSNATTTCDKCGKAYQVGQWPFCPHGEGAAMASKQYPFTTKNFTGQPIEVTSAAHEKALCAQYGVRKRDDVAWTEQSYKGYDIRTGRQIYKEGNGVGLPGCWV